MKQKEGSLKIQHYRYDTASSPEAMILLIHGLGEHAGRYAEWAKRFNGSNVGMRLFDLPGHGLSEGRRGTMPGFDQIYDIIDETLASMSDEYPGVPIFIYGHSLGGGIVLGYLIKRKPSITGAIVTSPWIKLTNEPPKSKVLLANIMKKIMPDLTQSSGLNSAHLSHDIKVVEGYDADPLVHDLISVRLFSEVQKTTEDILRNSESIDLPILLVHGRDDMITSSAGTIEVAAAAPRALLKLWEGGYHELHNEPLKEDHFAFIREWINSII
jgi:alpha-beta hydrolase superfamily lysophospholipase